MTHRVGSFLRKSRQKMRLDIREKSKISLSQYFKQFTNGDKVALKIHSAVFEGRFFPRFQGLCGVIVGKRGSCYEIKIRDGDKEKKLIVHPIHLKRIE